MPIPCTYSFFFWQLLVLQTKNWLYDIIYGHFAAYAAMSISVFVTLKIMAK
jgi:hypothetical protein